LRELEQFVHDVPDKLQVPIYPVLNGEMI